MFRRWWRSLGFYWQIYLLMVLVFGGIIMFVEGIAEPFVQLLIDEKLHLDAQTSEIILWVVSVLLPTLAVGLIITHLVVHRMTSMVDMAKRLSCGDFAARIEATGNEKDVFNQLAGVFNGMADSLERLIAHEKRLLADISHELRSPLTRMSVATALLPAKRESGELNAMVKVLDDEISQMNALVGMLLQQGRDRLKDRREYSRIALAELAGEVVGAHALVAADGGKSIRFEVVREAAVLGHPVGLRMIVENIVSNALFYSPAGGRVEVRIDQDGECAFLSVRDRGPGVPEQHVRNIFKAFFRVDQSRSRASGGTGLGLTLAHDAAVAMGGDIEARNASPGLEVIVSLPCASRGANA